MTTQLENKPSFDSTYEDWRPRLYRALVLATGDRDASVDAVDAAFSRRRRAIAHGNGAPPAEALGAARRQLTRKRRDYSGFRLPDEPPGPETVAFLDALRSIDLDDRLAVVASVYLGWDDETVGRALGMLPAEASQRIQVGTSRVLGAVGSTDPSALDRAFADAAERTAVPLSRLDTVKRDAVVRRAGVFAGAVAVAALAGGGVLLATQSMTGDTPDDRNSTVAGPALPSSGALADLEWNRAVLPGTGNGEIQNVAAGDDGYLALLMDYDSGTQQPVVLASPNGLDWEPLGEMPIGQQGGWVSQLVFSGDRWVAMGSTFDPANGRDRPVVLHSEDGASWTPVEIVVTDTIQVGGIDVAVGTSPVSAVVSGDTITVFGSQWGDFEQIVREFLPDDVNPDFGWGVDSDGTIDIYDGNGNVAHTFTADELGLPEEALSLMQGNRLVAYRSTDGGETWDELPLPGSSPGWANSAGGTGDMVLASFGLENGSALYRLDGDEWVRVDVGRGGSANGVATFDGQLYAAGSGADGSGAVWRSVDGETWEEIEIPEVQGVSFQSLSANPHGLVAMGYPGGALAPAEVTVDDLTVSISSGGVYTVTDASGEVVTEAFQEDLDTSDGVVIPDPETGEPLVTVSREEIDAAWQRVWQEQDQAFAGEMTYTMLASTDGEHWVRLPIEEALPAGFSPNYQAVGPTGVILAGWAESAVPVVGGNGQQLWAGTVPET